MNGQTVLLPGGYPLSPGREPMRPEARNRLKQEMRKVILLYECSGVESQPSK